MTRLAAVIGDPARHSLSPALHNAAFQAVGADWVYVAFDVAPDALERCIDAVRVLNVGGLSVTMPHKSAVLGLCDHQSPDALALGAANCVVANDNGTLTAHNTDGDGFVRGVEHDTGFDVAGSSVVVLGAGGAARAVIVALANHGASEVVVVNRSPERAAEAAALAPNVARVGDQSAIEKASLVVNATPIGMAGRDGLPCSTDLLGANHTVVDLIYAPRTTAWLQAASQNGATTANGLSMLVFQAATQFTLWTGHEAPIETMFAAVASQLAE